MIAPDSPVPFYAGSLEKGGLTMSWSEELWYYDYKKTSPAQFLDAECLLLWGEKRVLAGETLDLDSDPERWMGNRVHLACTPDQEILRPDGIWTRAGDLRPQDQVQTFCGIGHVGVLTGIVPAGIRRCARFTVEELGTVCVGLFIVKLGPRKFVQG